MISLRQDETEANYSRLKHCQDTGIKDTLQSYSIILNVYYI